MKVGCARGKPFNYGRGNRGRPNHIRRDKYDPYGRQNSDRMHHQGREKF